MNLLKRSEVKDIGLDRQKIVESIEKSCASCQSYAQMLRRFKFTIKVYKDFSHTVYADIFYTDGKPILHSPGEEADFQAAY